MDMWCIVGELKMRQTIVGDEIGMERSHLKGLCVFLKIYIPLMRHLKGSSKCDKSHG